MTLKQTLITLFLTLGAALCFAVALQFRSAFDEYSESVELIRSNLAREYITRSSLVVNEERTHAFLNLLGVLEDDLATTDLERRTDLVLGSATVALAQLQDDESLAALQHSRNKLVQLRLNVGAVDDKDRGAVALRVLDSYSEIADELLALRISLLSREPSTDPQTTSVFRLRTYSSLLINDLAITRAVIGGLGLIESPTARREALTEARRSSSRTEVAVELLEDYVPAIGQNLQRSIVSLVSPYRTVYQPAERDLFAAFEAGLPVADPRWDEQAQELALIANSVQEDLLSYSRDQLEARREGALQTMIFWIGLMMIGVTTAVAGSRIVLHRVVAPLDRLRIAMLALADGNVSVPLPETNRRDEIGVMADTLRVFKANAIRRARLQDERLALHEKLKATYGQLRRDLESAAAVQAALLPLPKRFGGVRFLGHLQPSHFISGDTYDVLHQPDGSVHFFVIDVAGHGAAAALVSVASHYTLTQAILRRPAGEKLAETVQQLNSFWPDHLPYFTMVVGELQPELGRGVLVQSGHPPPFLLRRGGTVEALGSGGLPIGVLPGATFDEVHFGFEPGDRILLYSDGLTEAENNEGLPFTEHRLIDLVQEQVQLCSEHLLGAITEAAQQWRTSETLDDDMTLLILEATLDEHDQEEAWGRAGSPRGRGTS